MAPAPDETHSPPSGGPWAFLAWLVGQRWRRALLGAALGCAWMVGLVLPPYLLARAVDALATGGAADLIVWSLALLGSGALLAGVSIWRHRTMTWVRLDAAYRTVAVVTEQTSRLGATLRRQVGAGEVMAIGVGDVWTIGRSLTVTGPGVGAVLAYVVIAVLLAQTSLMLALVVLLGVPALVLVLGPALGRLQAVGTSYRAAEGALTGRIFDVIAGLPVLNGLGGKALHAQRLRTESQALQREGYRLGRVTSVIRAAGLGLPTLFLAVVVWLAARLAAEGSITAGQLVAVYGYAAVLVVPVSSFIESAVDISRALVAARRVTDLVALRRDDEASEATPPAGGDLVDTVTGVTARVGEFTVVAVDAQADATALVDRLGGLREGGRWNGEATREIEPTSLRRHVLVADHDATLFAGSLADAVAGREEVDEERVAAALRTAVIDDLIAGLPTGLSSRIEADGRNLSGGQRQRLRLARAVLADPPVLVALDPTSAVDAATEALIVERLVSRRRGRTTLAISTSAVVLAAADEVHLVVGGRLVASGTHLGLLQSEPAYAALVERESLR